MEMQQAVAQTRLCWGYYVSHQVGEAVGSQQGPKGGDLTANFLHAGKNSSALCRLGSRHECTDRRGTGSIAYLGKLAAAAASSVFIVCNSTGQVAVSRGHKTTWTRHTSMMTAVQSHSCPIKGLLQAFMFCTRKADLKPKADQWLSYSHAVLT